MTTTVTAFGPQYREDDHFKRRARFHQSRYRVEQLGVTQFRDYGNRLCPADALAGRNFYAWPGILDAVAKRFRLGDKKLYFDMLASDHIPFNFFVPLARHEATHCLVSEWASVDVAEVTAVEHEWAPKPKARFLDDNTSFDAYITYRGHDGCLGAIGIEVKFTEREYPWGNNERARMFDPASIYQLVHLASGLYTADSLQHLPTPRLKQIWRNQLLGEAMLQRRELNLAHFTSVLLYPDGNTHFGAVAREYERLLMPTTARTVFRALTFETFIAQCRKYARSPEHQAWTDYLEQRYIVA